MSRNLLSRRALGAIVIGGATLAALLLSAVVSGGADAFDRGVFLWLHHSEFAPATHPGWLREGVRDLTALGSFVVLAAAVLGSAGYLMAAHRRLLALLLVVSAICATAVSTALKVATGRGRPDLLERAVETFTASFPSGHAFLSAAILLTLAGLLARASPREGQRRVIVSCAVVLTLAVGLSRVYLGVHWPSDVLAGWLLGAAWAAGTLVAAEADEKATAVQISGRGLQGLS
jgi:undecaprenyl-diphosphatase